MIRLERDPAFWMQILDDPFVVAKTGRGYAPAAIAELMAMPKLTPLAATHGGFWFHAIDSFSRVHELHTMFTPAGCGREVHGAAKEAFNRMFHHGAEVIVTHQMEANPSSQPPRSFGFKQVGAYGPSAYGNARTWMLTREAWLASPGGRSSCQ